MKRFRICQIPWKIIIVSAFVVSAFELLYLEYSFRLYLESFPDFLGIDAFFFYYGNYPGEVEKGFSMMHYAMVLLSFIIAFYFVTSDIHINTCEMLYYILIRREEKWKQIYMDLKRILATISLWQLAFNAMSYIFLSYIYGWSGKSYFLKEQFNVLVLWRKMLSFTFRQISILFVMSIFLYFFVLVINEFWGIICIISTTAIKLFFEFGKKNKKYGLICISSDFRWTMLCSICVLGLLYILRKQIVKVMRICLNKK